jgi:hypothetical protein
MKRPVGNACSWPSCIDLHDAESLLPGGRGVQPVNDEATLPRVR